MKDAINSVHILRQLVDDELGRLDDIRRLKYGTKATTGRKSSKARRGRRAASDTDTNDGPDGGASRISDAEFEQETLTEEPSMDRIADLK